MEAEPGIEPRSTVLQTADGSYLPLESMSCRISVSVPHVAKTNTFPALILKLQRSPKYRVFE